LTLPFGGVFYYRCVAGCWFLVAGSWLLIADCWLLVAAQKKINSNFKNDYPHTAAF
jgi:hypothetical protein